MKKFLTIGGATKDIFINFDNEKSMQLTTKAKTNFYILLEEGLKIDVINRHTSTGGGATNSAVSLKKLGLNVNCCFKIGNDKAGEFILEELKKAGVLTDYVIVSDEHDTAISYILPTLNHNYTALCYRGANKFLEKHQLPFKYFKEFDYVYITSLSGDSANHLPEITKSAKENNLFVINNPGSTQLVKLPETIYRSLPYIDILILNALEAEQLFSSIIKTESVYKHNLPIDVANNPIIAEFVTYHDQVLGLYDFFVHVQKMGPKIIVVTNGAHGVYIFHEDTILFHPSIETEIISSIGGGDAFGSCFSGSLALSIPIEKALIFGLLNSASVISQIDTKQGLLTLKELEERYLAIGSDKLQKFVFHKN